MLDTIIAVLIEKGLDGKAKSTESALLRDALRERLAREVRLKLALWSLMREKRSARRLTDSERCAVLPVIVEQVAVPCRMHRHDSDLACDAIG